MLFLLRNIRRKLLTGNKVTTYLLYAIGEIFLVVVGILIAVSIDDWNESEKREKKEIEILKELSSGIVQDLEDMTGNLARYKSARESQQIVMDWLENDNSYYDSLDMYISNSFAVATFISNDAAYETLKTYGIDIISNNALRQELIEYYDESFEYYEAAEAYQMSLTYKIQDDFSSIFNQYQTYNISDFSLMGKMTPIDANKLKANVQFKYWLRTQNDFIITMIEFVIIDMIDKAEKLQQNIMNEIELLEAES